MCLLRTPTRTALRSWASQRRSHHRRWLALGWQLARRLNPPLLAGAADGAPKLKPPGGMAGAGASPNLKFPPRLNENCLFGVSSFLSPGMSLSAAGRTLPADLLIGSSCREQNSDQQPPTVGYTALSGPLLLTAAWRTRMTSPRSSRRLRCARPSRPDMRCLNAVSTHIARMRPPSPSGALRGDSIVNSAPAMRCGAGEPHLHDAGRRAAAF